MLRRTVAVYDRALRTEANANTGLLDMQLYLPADGIYRAARVSKRFL